MNSYCNASAQKNLELLKLGVMVKNTKYKSLIIGFMCFNLLPIIFELFIIFEDKTTTTKQTFSWFNCIEQQLFAILINIKIMIDKNKVSTAGFR